MARVISKTTMRVHNSVHTPDFPSDEWIVNPDLPACAEKYWKVEGDEVQEMTAREKEDADALEEAADEFLRKEQYIQEKILVFVRAEAIKLLKAEGILDANGDLIGG